MKTLEELFSKFELSDVLVSYICQFDELDFDNYPNLYEKYFGVK